MAREIVGTGSQKQFNRDQEIKSGNNDGIEEQQEIINKQNEYFKEQRVKRWEELLKEYSNWE